MIKTIFVWLVLMYSIVLARNIYVQQPKVYEGYESIKGWYISEKLDGIRVYWDGKQLLTKNGNAINSPKWFTKDFPPFKLDGELWTKRGDFENIQSIVLDYVPTERWREITYHVFEVPEKEGNFIERLEYVKKYSNDILQVIEQIKCKNREHLDQYLQKIEKLGGEGIIVKNPTPSYFIGRSPHILKVKSFSDMEGVVIGINEGKGKFKNLMGSLTVSLDNGVTFKLGGGFELSDRKTPPIIDSVITFKHYGFTKNYKPRFASFLRVRKAE